VWKSGHAIQNFKFQRKRDKPSQSAALELLEKPFLGVNNRFCVQKLSKFDHTTCRRLCSPPPPSPPTMPCEINRRSPAVQRAKHQRGCTSLRHCGHCLCIAALKFSPALRSSSSRNIMSSASFWSEACETAMNEPLQTLLNAVYASCGATVRRARAANCALPAAV
jgi:hypothetical protein